MLQGIMKKEQTKPNVSGRKEKITIKAEIIKIRRTIEKSTKLRVGF